MDYMKSIPDNFFRLAITDPPYGIREDGKRNATRGLLAKPTKYKPYWGGDRQAPGVEYFQELQRISVNQIVWGANHFIDNISGSRNSSCWIVWDKDNAGTDFADCELAWTSFKSAVRKFKFRWNGMLQEDMKNKEKRIHPNQKPVALYRWLLQKYAKKNDRIFDSHLGSGSHRIAAYQLGLDFYACEIDAHYYHLQEQRFFKECLQINNLL
ncbi:site-specific DNA-methyltransferase (adenine-specific) [Porphyromonadaceae bacterium KH3CP3RA]|nr:site-specific DNA-methyltransferase (adenine-specific) [Porphyromonadaceae bacterium KH3CP3RA]